MKYHFKPKEQLNRINPEEMGLVYTSVQRVELCGATSFNTGGEEACLVCIKGETGYQCSGKEGTAILKDMLYVPCNTEIILTSQSGTVLLRYGAPSSLKSRFSHIRFSDVDRDGKKHHVYGTVGINCRRHVWNFIDEEFESSRFLIGMCKGEMGGWTAWPPHEHTEKREEVYAYFDMRDAFGIQCVYEDMDNPLAVVMVREGDLISVPRGYHPNVGCPGGKMSFVYCMVSKKAGDRNFMDLKIQDIYGDKFK